MKLSLGRLQGFVQDILELKKMKHLLSPQTQKDERVVNAGKRLLLQERSLWVGCSPMGVGKAADPVRWMHCQEALKHSMYGLSLTTNGS